jgi:hypothetical protein
MLSLSKLNWNVTQFDGGEPITVRALGVGGSGDADDLFFEQENKRSTFRPALETSMSLIRWPPITTRLLRQSRQLQEREPPCLSRTCTGYM